MPYLISFDPGVYTGLAIGRYDVDTPYEFERAHQTSGGAEGLPTDNIINLWAVLQYDEPVEVVSEKFTPRNLAGMSHTQESVEPLRVEGVLVALFEDIHWQEPSAQNLVTGKTPAETKKLSDDFLRYHGLYQEPSTIEGRQKNDANSAIKHALAYLKGIGHKPTIDKYWRNYNG